MLNEAAGWIAPVATILGATMTAVNLGARLTGWGFVVFTLASLGWICVGVATGQTNLVVANAMLTVVNLAGVWRWLGRQSAHEDGGKAAKEASRRSSSPTLFTATGIAGMPLVTPAGETIGKAVEALVECRSAAIGYVVVSTAGTALVDETLRAVPRAAVIFQPDQLLLRIARTDFDALAPLAKGEWPASVQGPGGQEPGGQEPGAIFGRAP